MPKKNSSSKRRRKPLTDTERQARRDAQRERMVEATKALQTSGGWKRWIGVRRHNGLHRYSSNNQFLLVCEAYARGIELSYVAGYRWWSDNGYQVRKGEKALHVLGPVSRKLEDEQTGEEKVHVVGFRDVAVFDRSQVDAGPEAKPLAPPPAEPTSGETHAELLPKLEAFAAGIGSEVRYSAEGLDQAAGSYRSSTKRITIRPAEPNAMVSVLLHELAHAQIALKRDEKSREVGGHLLDYAEEECVVECAAHVAASVVGLDTSAEAIPYVAGWGLEGKLDVVTAAATLVDEIAGKLEDACGDRAADTDREAVAA